MRDHIWVNSRNRRLSVMVHIPAGFVQGTTVVVLCHGFIADKIGTNQLTKNLACFIEELGYGVVRFDYAGSGDSDGDFATDTSIAGWRQDLESILAWVHGQVDFAKSPILLYGHSLGGLVVLTHPAEDIRIVARIAFAPVTQVVENFRDIILGQELWQRSLHGKSITNFYGRSLTLNPQFVEDLVKNTYSPTENLVGSSQPLLLIHGMGDADVPLSGTEDFYAAYSGQKELVITDFDHVAAGQQQELQQIIGKWLADQFPLA